ncbi:TRAP transporter small permease [Rhizobium sp. 18065]|uniref:TRAP transporter small permease n=1 Tax=Rhizobium sp. 18065 TaxID=2681411 RepID=UPI001359E4DF|nr:TRAP transporter small permease [Rhizobium sp. 18065]
MSKSPSLLGKPLKGATDFAAGIAVFGVLLVVLLQVSSRLLGLPVSWTEEATRYLFVWMIFLGLAAGFRTVETARVTVLIAMMPAFIRRLSVPIYVVSSVVFFALTGWTGYHLVQQQLIMNETAATLAIPMWLIGTIMPLSSILGVLAIVESLRTRRDLIELPDPLQGMPQLTLAEHTTPKPEKQP